MHIIFNGHQKINRRQTTMSLFFYATAFQILAHGLHAQLLAEKIPLGKSFSHSYLSMLLSLLFFYFIFQHILALSFHIFRLVFIFFFSLFFWLWFLNYSLDDMIFFLLLFAFFSRFSFLKFIPLCFTTLFS